MTTERDFIRILNEASNEADVNSSKLRKYITDTSPFNTKIRHSKTQNQNRVQWTIRNDDSPFESDFMALFPNVEIAPAPVKLSGRVGLVGYEITTTADIVHNGKTIPSGTKCYVGVFSKEKGIIDNKELTPTNLGLADGKKRSPVEIIQTVTNHLKTDRWVNTTIRKNVFIPYLRYLMWKAYNAKIKTSIEIQGVNRTQEILKQIPSQDISKITKDFGEVLCAIHIGKERGHVSFPSGNQPLIDFTLHPYNRHEGIENYSVKDGKGGAAPSLQSIEAELIEMSKGDFKEFGIVGKEAEVVEVLKLLAVHDCTSSDKILRISEYLLPDTYKFLEKLCGTTPTSATLTVALTEKRNEFATPEEFYAWLSDNVYKKIHNASSLTSIKNYYLANEGERGKYLKTIYGCITSPLAYAVNYQLNTRKVYTDILNKIAHTLSVFQIYISIGAEKSDLKFMPFPFKDMKFEFYTNPTTSNPNNRSIGFRAVKQKKKD